MNAADKLAQESGINMWQMMQNAGSAVAATALRSYPGALRFVVLCGPGNNGGDGYIAAHALQRSGALVDVYRLGRAPTDGDAGKASAFWGDRVRDLHEYQIRQGDVIIDALFGAGLGRPLDGSLNAMIHQINSASLPVVSADLPTGIDGRSGTFPVGSGGGSCALKASHTVTFMCQKPGHLLLPGREYCGVTEVVDIGIPDRIVRQLDQGLRVNAPSFWKSLLRDAAGRDHKYSRGHLGVLGGHSNATGAARLSAAAALKAGAGAVTLLAPSDALPVNAAHLTAVMLKEASKDILASTLEDPRVTAFVLGPGFGVGEETRQLALTLSGKPLVLDADAITSFQYAPELLFSALKEGHCKTVLTPHQGEFARLFPDLAADENLSKIDRAKSAAKRANSIVIYKGADSVIAAPDGRAYINVNAPPWLATAGSGDVLAGIAGSLLAQGVPAFEAAAAAVWLHADAANRLGQGLTAETLADAVRPFRDSEE